MRFSVVMASYLGEYGGAACRRDEKIVRAVDSVIAQTFPDWELQVVADGCQQTVDIVSRYTDPRVHVTYIDKRPFWDGGPRNTGIEISQGEFIVYLDNDDCYGENHLKIIDRNLKHYDWVWYNDYIYDKMTDNWHQRHCDIRKIGMNGTSNVCHKRSLDARWGYRGYAHDHYFNQKLLMFQKNAKVEAPEYFVMHMPNIYDL